LNRQDAKTAKEDTLRMAANRKVLLGRLKMAVAIALVSV